MKKLIAMAGFIGQLIQNHAGEFAATRDALAAVIAAEARGDGEAGMIAVAQVIRNRGGDPLMQVLRRHQFSCLNTTTIGQLISKMRKEDGWRTAQVIAVRLMRDPKSLGDSVHGANHFESANITPFWAIGLRPTAIIGGHRFYHCR